MLIAVLLFIVGLVLLIKGGDWFVDGSTSIARKFKVPDLLIGATVVSIGTTLPEVMVSATGALQGHSQIAYGNAIGSVICNTALIAAITIAIIPSVIDRRSLRVPAVFFAAAAAFYMIVAYTNGYFSRIIGGLFLLIFIAYIGVSIYQAKHGEAEESEEEIEEMPTGKTIILFIAGAAAIAVGARLLVDNGTIIARELGVPEAVIALTFVALGTSLPELVTAINSISKGHGLLSIGNIVGANLFNLVLVNGVAAFLAPYSIPCNSYVFGINSTLVVDLPVMVGVMAILIIPSLIKGKLYRGQGILLLATYAAFCAYQFIG